MSKKKKQMGGRFNTVTSCISMTMVLLLLGTVVFFTLVARNFSQVMRENFMVEVLLNDNAPHNDLVHLQNELRAAPYARRVNYLSKEQGTREMSEALQDGPAEFQGFNPIPAEFEVYLHADYANKDSIARFESELRKNPNVMDVVYPVDVMDSVNSLIPIVGLVLLVVAGLLLVVSVALINNTVRMSVYAHRMSIHSMKLVGARWSFIRRPFMLRALGIGLVSALLAGGVLGTGIYLLLRLHIFVSELVTPFVTACTLGAVAVCGIGLTLLCAFFSVNRFLRMKGGEVFLK